MGALPGGATSAPIHACLQLSEHRAVTPQRGLSSGLRVMQARPLALSAGCGPAPEIVPCGDF